MRFSTSGFFHKSVSPLAPEYAIGIISIFFENSRINNEWMFVSGVDDTRDNHFCEANIGRTV